MFKKIKYTVVFLSLLLVSYGLAAGLLKMASANTDVYTSLSVFTSVLDRIQDDYVEVPDMDNVLKGAIQGMMEAVDPYSSFVDGRTYTQVMNVDRDAGIGVSLAKRYGYAYVVSVERGSPAWESGMRSGDLIESIGGLPTGTMSLWEAENRLKGPEGTSIDIRAIRTRMQSPLELTIAREASTDEQVSVRVLDGDIGLIRIPDFQEGTEEELAAGIKKLVTSDVQGLIIDLRDVFRGDLDEAVKAADLFLGEGNTIVTITIRDREVEVISATQGSLLPEIPQVVLVNGGTAGSAEVFIAALADNGKAKTLGNKTEGRGSIQQKLPLESNAFLFLSRELLVRPNGDPIQNRSFRESGIKPDKISPERDFVTDFTIENGPQGVDEELGVDFFRKLDRAIEEEQLETAKEFVRDLIDNPELSESDRKAAQGAEKQVLTA